MKKFISIIAIALLLATSVCFCCCSGTEKEEALTTFTVSFNTNGGNKINSVKVSSGEKVPKPNNPVKPDDAKYSYTFIEWRLNEKKFNFETPITGNITLVAVYKSEQKYTPEYPPQDL